MERAFEHISAGARFAGPVIAAEEENLLSKASAIARFLEHDDALLATDALKALCEQLKIDRIDVSDSEGVLIASSDATRVSLPLGDQAAFAWTTGTLDDPQAALTEMDEDDPGVLYACVARPDIEGFILLTRDDPYVRSALTKSVTESVIADLSYGKDALIVSAIDGEDGSSPAPAASTSGRQRTA
ncbi:MAG: hypothetical protein R2912_09995 [Eubacteriales bacterium]